MIKQRSSARVDLVGGTLDIFPISLVLRNSTTINFALSIFAETEIQDTNLDHVIIESKEYNTSVSSKEIDSTSPLYFALRIIHFFCDKGLKISLSSNIPPGSGLGGSSTMGINLFKALMRKFNKTYAPSEIVSIVSSIEASILNAGPVGIQDYYPALYGGILAIKGDYQGTQIKQLWSEKRSNMIKNNFTLIYSGKTRNSGFNNWSVYKSFFDRDKKTVALLEEIAENSHQAYNALLQDNEDNFISRVLKDGELREKLCPNIITEEMKVFSRKADTKIKVCGAGGGGCFLALKSKNLDKYAKEFSMNPLEFSVQGELL